ncbi:MAG: FecR domain-containing protein [Rhodopirellula sp. JB044]|uniref:FecR domain-containing protein n=1 Tax=Rhodopirellula sp. JB044 TaxID=3342844 RepID=UPI00370A8D59
MSTKDFNVQIMDSSELISRYLDGDLDDTHFAELQKRMADREFSRMLAEYSVDHVSYYELGLDQRLASEDVQVDAAVTKSSVTPWPAAIIAIAACLLVAIGWWGFGRNSNNIRRGTSVVESSPSNSIAPELGEIEQRVIGKVTMVKGRLAALDERVKPGMLVHSNQSFSIEAMAGTIGMEFLDGTAMKMIGPAEVVCSVENGQKRVTSQNGNLLLSVKPQPPGKPLLVVTPKAVLEVLGTELAISADLMTTKLRVNHGHVLMRRIEDGSQVNVKADQKATVSPSVEMHAEQVSQLPDTWEANFEDGLPESWIAGEILESSPGAVTAVPVSNRWGLNYTITSNVDYTDGLFQIHEDSYLNYRIRMKESGFYQVLFESRRSDFQGVIPNHEYQETHAEWMKEDRWHTVSIPFTAFRHSIANADGTWPDYETRSRYPRMEELVPFFVQFSTLGDDLGLSVDRIWVSRGMPDGTVAE